MDFSFDEKLRSGSFIGPIPTLSKTQLHIDYYNQCTSRVTTPTS